VLILDDTVAGEPPKLVKRVRLPSVALDEWPANSGPFCYTDNMTSQSQISRDCDSASPENLQALYDMLLASRHCVAFTGAGVSTLSGIRDFRGKNGLYKTPDADKIFDIDIFRQDPSFYYKMTKDFIYGLDDKKPSVVHKVLAELEKRGILKAIITQNIDLLHQKAGSRRVIEIHGSPSLHHCPRCAWSMTFSEVAAIVRAGDIPRCKKCDAVLKPDITFFGESLPAEALAEAIEEARSADLLLVLGSTLLVYPAATLPEYTLEHGGRLVIVNDMATHLDAAASLRFSDLGSVFDFLEKKLKC
jgi:NAD-dependent deacetylase